ncbi:Six-hairpin glycosidase-like protein [Mycena rosella]|uniref:Trehalase n=1 Tax=Mycena rosella TaxID=1033263 RepID=A0AAD7D7E4_MYCRO|nr:Six-hairpin glycosidase-like protein [Mycena rosella]
MSALKMFLMLEAFACVIYGVAAELTAGQMVLATPPWSAPALLPSQAPLPPTQPWCPSQIFCPGPLLQTLSLSGIFEDPKTIVDKPTAKPAKTVLADFAALASNPNLTEGQVVSFVRADFADEGQELAVVPLPGFKDAPAFLSNIPDPLLKAFAQKVHGFWTQLVRVTNASTLCTEGACESSLIPLNHTFVVPGGRFREQYYWDSFWVIEGLLESELFSIANDTLQNFMDEIALFGFIPNGGRTYYLNRSQPPLFIQMLARYVAATNDTAILARALPLAERELAWWAANRTVNVRSPFTGKTYAMAQYSATNTAPRPESYLQDYLTAHDPTLPALNASQRAALYAELASGAETGWDYSSRYLMDPTAGLRTLNVKSIVPVDLNSILYKNRVLMAQLYGTRNNAAAARHTAAATALKAGVLDLFWNGTKLAFYDFNLATNTRNNFFSAATFYPFWSGIVPSEVLASAQNAFGAFASLNMVLNRYHGTLPVSFIESGLQWDAPNTWPPHQYIALQALRALPPNVTAAVIPAAVIGHGSFSLVPAGQLGVSEAALPLRNLDAASGPAADVSRGNGTVVNGGNTTSGGWAAVLGVSSRTVMLQARCVAGEYDRQLRCGPFLVTEGDLMFRHATGGSIPGLLPRLSDKELNVTQSTSNTGNMFEKFSILDINSAGRGGEYTVQAGFGWTNGVLLWVASNYGGALVAPQCPSLLPISPVSPPTAGGPGGSTSGARGLWAPSLRAVGALVGCSFGWVLYIVV